MRKFDSSSRARHAVERLGAACREVGKCLALGLRDALSARLMIVSAISWLGAFFVCTTVFIVWRHEALAFSSMLAVLLAFGAFSIAAGILPSASLAAGASVSGMGAVNPVALASFGSSLLAAMGVFALMVILLPFVLYGLAMLLSMRIVLKLCMMEPIRQEVLKRHPDLQINPHMPGGKRLLAGLRQLLSFFGCVALCLIVPMLGAVLLCLLLCYWNAYGLIHRALDGIAGDEERAAVVKGQKIKLIVLGASSAVITFIPFIGLVGPAVTGSSVCHFVMRRLATLRTFGSSSGPDHQSAYGSLSDDVSLQRK